MGRVLVVDDEQSMRRSLVIALQTWGYSVSEAGSGDHALEILSQDIFDAVITDLVMEGMDGLGLLDRIKSVSPSTDVVLMSGFGTIDRAVTAIKKGAVEFLVKPFPLDHLEVVLQRIFDQRKMKATLKHLKAVLADQYPFEDIIAVSPKMRETLKKAAAIANTPAPVLILGESGSGKELVAIAIHHLSGRAEKPFVPVNCGAFPETLLDSELFGHTKGAFTGAVHTKRGLIEEADEGTLFLDEIGEAPAALQVRLLRFLDNGRFRRIGETRELSSDVRIIAATNRPLEKDLEQARFRQDLYYRLAVTVIEIPPLRERPEDIQALSQRFLQIYSRKQQKEGLRMHPQVYQLFMKYAWPGNVREMENTIEHAVIMTDGPEIGVKDLPPKFYESSGEPGFTMEEDVSLASLEKKYILSVLERTGGNKKQASDILKISRTTLISRLKNYDK